MCRFSKLLLFSFFFCKDGSDRLMKRASYSCNFLCVVIAAAYLKYRRCRLSCLPFVWHFFFFCDTHLSKDISLEASTYSSSWTGDAEIGCGQFRDDLSKFPRLLQ